LVDDRSIGLEEIDAILHQATGSNKGEKSNWKKHKAHTTRWQDGVQVAKSPTSALKKEHYLLVDGYNVIFAFEPLRELAQVTFDGARDRLLELLCNYQAIKNQTILVVFDAYKVPGNLATVTPYHNIYQVFTKESQTADAYIEHFVHHHAKDYTVTVATSDGLEQIIIRGQGCGLLSARELMEDVARTNAELLATYQAQQPQKKNYLHDRLDEATKQKLIRP
jgi:predicted RNA-binding protein with PIN domain